MVLARTWMALVVLSIGATSSGQTLSFSRTDHASSAGPRGIAAADFNRDGAIDLALANNGRKSVTVLLNFTRRGQGFVVAHDIELGGGPFDLTTGDVNHDNVTDIAVANADGNTIDVLLGQDAGGFAPPVRVGAMGNPRGLTLHDMDRDGKLDIIYTQYHFNSVQVLHGDGSGWNFVARKGAATTGSLPQGVVALDFNWDGKPDLAVANTGGALAVLYQTDAGTFQRVEVAGPLYSNVLTADDFDADGRIDIAAASTANSRVAIYRNAASGLTYTNQYPTGSSPRGIDAADLNKDGSIDITTANRSGNSVTVLLGRQDAPGTFRAPTTIAAGSGSRAVAVGDYNTDGLLDMATANEYGHSVTILTNTSRPPASVFWEARDLPSSQGTGWLTLADFNKNGRVDVIQFGGVILDGEREVSVTSSTPGFRYATGAAPGDFNKDGNPDFVHVAQYEPSKVILDLYYGDGAGGFRHAGGFDPSSPWLHGIRAADVTSDGRLDLVVLDRGDDIRVLEGIEGGFAARSRTALRSFSPDFDLADVNRDGKLDVVTAHPHYPSYGVQILHGDGAGNFVPAAFYAASSERRAVNVGDLNGDGLLDIVTGGSRVVTVWMGAADGSFTGPTNWAEPSNSEQMVLGDFSGDGRLDILTGYSGLFRGRGDGTFADAEPVNMAWHAGEAVDYDRDGRLDVIVAIPWHVVALMSRGEPGPNLNPIAHAGRSFELGYEWQFEDDIWLSGEGSFDPNLDELAFEWRDSSGRILSTEQGLGLPLLDPGSHTFTLMVRDGRGGQASDTVTITIRPFKEPGGFHTGFSAAFFGAWSRTDDPSAAQGERAWHADAGAPKVSAALSNPVNYVDMFVLADPTQRYKLWLRLKAQNNFWGNDSVFVQFEHGVITADGHTRYRVGTSDALEINLEQCSGCGVSGWGWRDERWGANLNAAPMLLRFPRSGYQRVRVQTREDGVSFDQLVLSAEKYRDVPPGAAKNDNTIVKPWWW